jgi:hypothetical protein
LKGIKDLQEGQYLHLAAKAGFEKKQDVPAQAYFSFRKKGADKNLFVNKYAEYNSGSQQFEVTLDIYNDLEHLNGEYEIQLHVVDFRAEKGINWELGHIQLWFKQGLDAGNNQGIKE